MEKWLSLEKYYVWFMMKYSLMIETFIHIWPDQTFRERTFLGRLLFFLHLNFFLFFLFIQECSNSITKAFYLDTCKGFNFVIISH